MDQNLKRSVIKRMTLGQQDIQQQDNQIERKIFQKDRGHENNRRS